LVLFIGVFLFSSTKGRRVSNILLGTFFFAIGLNLADTFLLLKQVYFNLPALALWGSNLLLICGPCIYLYTQSVVYKDFKFDKKKLRHFYAFIILFVVTEVSYLSAGYEIQTRILISIVERKIPPSVYIGSLVIYIHFLTYLFVSLRLTGQYSIAASDKYSEAGKVTLQWLNTIIIFFLVLMMVSFIGGWLSFLSLTAAYFFVITLTIFLLLLFIVFMLFKALQNPEIFAVLEEKEIQEAVLTPRYTSSVLPGDEKARVLGNLQQYMQAQKPYLEPELNLDKLAGLIAVKPKVLSQVINELLQQNFFEFVNFYRIEDAKKLLVNPKDKKITVLEVMYEVGFNSKSSFNTLFKRNTGLTPSDYKKQNMQ